MVIDVPLLTLAEEALPLFALLPAMVAWVTVIVPKLFSPPPTS